MTTLLRGALVLPDDERRTALEAAAQSLEVGLAEAVVQDTGAAELAPSPA